MASDQERRWRRPLSPLSSSNDRDKDRKSPGPATSLTHAEIAQALLDSPDEGRTLDLSHKNLSDVGESGAVELSAIGKDDLGDECGIHRVALGYNRLATLPMAFALLARLRYLNLRANNFSTFPDVLTVMPSLEILDISRNKLKHLPSQPGTLLGLRVFCISKNRFTRLPEYLPTFSNLTVFQVDHNPIEWPPKHILEPLDGVEDADGMLSCIENIKKWINDHSSGSSRKTSDESPRGTQPSKFPGFTSDESETSANVSLPQGRFGSRTQHSRSFSAGSDISTYSTASLESNGSEVPANKDQDGELVDPPPSSNIISSFLSSSPSASPTFIDHNIAASNDVQNPGVPPIEDQLSDIEGIAYGQLHGRNASYSAYSVTRAPSPLNSRLSAKKSLPDLRGPSSTISERTRNLGQRSRAPMVVTGDGGETEARKTSQMTASLVDRGVPSPQNGIPADYNTPLYPHGPPHSRTPRSQSANNHRGIVSAAAEPMPSPVISPKGPAPSMDVERNSYFRRFSTLPPSTVSANIPQALLAMIDSARGILFAVSQIYQSLRHYTVFAIDDRLSGLLGKVLDPASTYVSHLINALDRFDSISRRGLPPPLVCRGVLESCRDIVAVFGKVVGVLHLQLKVLAGFDDARYSRSLLLMLYGSMAEISHSWQTMRPHLSAIQPLLREHRPPPPVASSSKLHAVTTAAPPSTRNGIPSSAERQPPMSSPIPRTSTTSQAGNAINGRSRMTRRHAGSFSTRDVQIGKALPTNLDEIHTPISPPPSVQPLRSALRKPTATSQTALPLPHSHPSSMDSQSSIHSSQGSSSPAVTGGGLSLPLPHQTETTITRVANSSLEVPSDSSKIVDEDLLDTMEAATETARSVWRMMDEVLHDTKETKIELLESLEWAQDITRRVKEEIREIRSGAVDGDRRAFWEDAHLFIKAVVNVSTILKDFSVSHPFSLILRGNIAKLTQSTQDFAILLQVSSFSPSATPGPYSPAMPPPTPMKAPTTNLSRARSAQAIQSPSSAISKSVDTPWTGLPHQTFKIPDHS